jgi:hypothetical protein
VRFLRLPLPLDPSPLVGEGWGEGETLRNKDIQLPNRQAFVVPAYKLRSQRVDDIQIILAIRREYAATNEAIEHDQRCIDRELVRVFF